MKFQKKPEIVDAIRWDGTKECEQKIKQMAGTGVFADWRKASAPIMVPTRSGQVRGEKGGWVVRDLLGILDYMTHEEMLMRYMPLVDEEMVPVRMDLLEVMVGRIVDAKLSAMTAQDPIPLDCPNESFSLKDEVNDD